MDSVRGCVGGAALSPGIVAARLLCRCFVTDRKVACLVCAKPTIVRHVRDYSEERSFDDKTGFERRPSPPRILFFPQCARTGKGRKVVIAKLAIETFMTLTLPESGRPRIKS